MDEFDVMTMDEVDELRCSRLRCGTAGLPPLAGVASPLPPPPLDLDVIVEVTLSPVDDREPICALISCCDADASG